MHSTQVCLVSRSNLFKCSDIAENSNLVTYSPSTGHVILYQNITVIVSDKNAQGQNLPKLAAI